MKTKKNAPERSSAKPRRAANRRPQERTQAATAGSVSEKDFNALMRAHDISGPKTVHAMRLHLVAGLSRAEAANRAGIHGSAVTRAAHRFERPVCPACGNPLHEAPRRA